MKASRVIAIVLGSKFRDTLDRDVKPTEINYKELVKEIKKTYDTSSLTLSSEEDPQGLGAKFESIVFDAISEVRECQLSKYDETLSEVVSDYMYDVEKYLEDNYSKEELETIANFIQSSAGRKIIDDSNIELQANAQKQKMLTTINSEIYNKKIIDKMNENMKNFTSDFMNKIITKFSEDDLEDDVHNDLDYGK